MNKNDNKPEEKKRQELALFWTQAQPVVRNYIAMSIRDRHAADDIIQEVAVAIARDYDSYDLNRSFKSWALGVARHRVLQYLDKVKRDRLVFDDDLLLRFSKKIEDISTRQIDYEMALEHCLSELPKNTSQVVLMKYLKNLRVREIAEITGRSQGAVTGLLRTARNILGNCISKRVVQVENG